MEILICCFCGNNSFTKIRFLASLTQIMAYCLPGMEKVILNINQIESGFKIRGDVRSCIQIGNKIFIRHVCQQLIAYSLKK